VWAPNTLGALAVGETNAWYVVQGIYLVVSRLMHRLMKFWDGGNEFRPWSKLDFLGPVRVDSFEEINEPLARDVVANEDYRDEKLLDCRAKDVVHIGISVRETGQVMRR